MHIISVGNTRNLRESNFCFIFLHASELQQSFQREAQTSLWIMQAVNYHRHVDSVDHREGLHHTGCDDGQSNKSHREIHFAFLPERYKPLVDEEERIRAKEQKKKKKKEQYKKVRKVSLMFLKSASTHLLNLLIRKSIHLSKTVPAFCMKVCGVLISIWIVYSFNVL